MNRSIAMAAFGAALALAAPATAQDQAAGGAEAPVVVELFTSQGCVACPPADELLAELAQRDDIIGLSLHVDYWNYLGWEDVFAQAAFTERQYGYGHAAGSTVVYTPQMIVGGQDAVMGARGMELAELVAAHRAAPDPVRITVTGGAESGYAIELRWTAEDAAPDMIVQLVAVSPFERVEISRGENAGRVAEHFNVVRDLSVLAEWDGERPFEASVMPQSDLQHVVIVQGAGHGPILSAAWLEAR